MTLLVTEIYVPGDLRNGMILFAADRRITVNGKPPKFMKKVFEVPYLNAGVGYYGLAQINQKEYLAGWLANFIRHATDCRTLQTFAEKLHQTLNQSVSKSLLTKYPSGFQVCGYNDHNYPELWHICNHGMEGNYYKDPVSRYSLSEDFLARDARKQGFDGTNPHVSVTFRQFYVNGDVRPFHSIWPRLDDFSIEMFSYYRDFKRVEEPSDYVKLAKWKMEVISSFYREFANVPLIGKPIDAFPLLPGKPTGHGG